MRSSAKAKAPRHAFQDKNALVDDGEGNLHVIIEPGPDPAIIDLGTDDAEGTKR